VVLGAVEKVIDFLTRLHGYRINIFSYSFHSFLLAGLMFLYYADLIEHLYYGLILFYIYYFYIFGVDVP